MKSNLVNIFMVISMSTILLSCKKDDNDISDVNSRKVEYRVTAQNVAINKVSYTDETGATRVITSFSTDNWSSGEIRIPNSITPLHIVAQGTDANISASSLAVSIYVNGELKIKMVDDHGVQNNYEIAASN